MGRSPKLEILDYLMDFPTNNITKKETIDSLGMSKQTFYKYFDDLEEVGIVKINRTIGKATQTVLEQAELIAKHWAEK